MLAIQKKLRYQIVKEQFLPGTAEVSDSASPSGSASPITQFQSVAQ
jgi:hypothetical protein